MAMILFYDPGRVHEQSYLDKDIGFISTLPGLRQSIDENNGIQQVLCICGPKKSAVINEVQELPQVKAIYWCGCAGHGEPYDNSLFNPKNRGDLIIRQRNGWELTCRSTTLEICIRDGSKEQALMELEKLREIEKKTLSLLQSSAETAKLLANQLNGLNRDLESKEATDSNCL
jgi:hypothetical protein